jgi:hypothetical protein
VLLLGIALVVVAGVLIAGLRLTQSPPEADPPPVDRTTASARLTTATPPATSAPGSTSPAAASGHRTPAVTPPAVHPPAAPSPPPRRVWVALTPQLPVRDLAAPRSWIGGHPSLPDDVPWPVVQGRSAAFLAQIALADLPPGLWRGDGPREGWLVFFLTPDSDVCAPVVLHTRSLGQTREGTSPKGAYWYARRMGDEAPPHPPRWPLDAAVFEGEGPGVWGDQEEPEVPPPDPLGADPLRDLELDLADPSVQPWDLDTTRAMLGVLRARVETAVSARARREEAVAQKKWAQPSPEDQALLDAVDAGAVDAQAALDSIIHAFEARAAAGAFTPSDIPALVDQLAQISLPRAALVEDRETVQRTGRRFRPDEPEVLTRPRDSYGSARWIWLKPWRHAAQRALATDPSALPPPVRALAEATVRHRLVHDTLRMGHVPEPYYHEEPGDDADHVALLELPGADLVDWMWSDDDHVLFRMSRADLAKGDFSKVETTYSN